ncbi:hypothetical protein Trco_001882 [Trichoderma cornu-damae]|uniref:Uncharacterized protein n=1 Tax=Trichoderma cornu-damae TaxID=654480 RepID=A0A9P8QNT5_9HYPO|nr:hypothetical protein Trco_001882 [Trichoderma cornu-damae]
MPKDALEVPDGTSTEYLWQDPAPRLSSIDFVSIKPELDVLCIPEDEEVEEACLVEDVAEVAPSPAVDWQHESPDRTNSAEKSSLSYFQDGGCPDLNRPLRRKFDEEPARLLPMSCDTSATSILLHNFMELRGIKRPRLHTGSAAVGRPMDGLPSKTNHEAHTRNDHQELPPTRVEETAPAPHFEIPARQASFLISVHLARPILRRLENAWAPENLIDIDYSRHNAVAGAPGAGQPKEVISPLSFEADISLSPSTAIIITSLLKVKQRPLPGSASQAPLRERVHKVSQRYETLIVLVSGPQPDGEFRGVLAPSDVAAYADFLTFAVALDGDVNVHLVPGAEDTMASWVLAFMSRHCRQSEALKRFLSPEETPWEIFLRQAGMNVVAAKVLSKTLFEQAGAYGLAAFLVMPVQERIARYGQLLGGEKVLRLTAKALDRKWG